MINLDLFHISTDRDGRYGALAEMYAYSNEIICPVCKCHKYEPKKLDSNRMVVTYAQKKWPDYLYCTNTDIVSERVVNDLVANNITGFQAIKMEFESIKPASKPAPMPYYYLQATGQAELLPVLPYDVPNLVCPVCGCWNRNYTLPNGVEVCFYPLKINKWDGQDFVNGFCEMRYRTCCSRRFIELAHTKKWTNFEFILPNTWYALARHKKSNREELLLQGLKKDFQARLDKFPQFNLPMPDFLLQVPDQPL